jgi:hypothetical protein
MRNEEFIRLRLVEESQKLVDARFYFPAFSLVSQGIETLGAFIDKKPLAAKAQSKKRFHLAIQQLFAIKYQQLNDNHWLYKQLRCNLSHMCSAGGFITLCSGKQSKEQHLDLIDGKRFFIIEDFVEDFHKACFEVINLLEKGELRQKAMALNEIDTHKP